MSYVILINDLEHLGSQISRGKCFTSLSRRRRTRVNQNYFLSSSLPCIQNRQNLLKGVMEMCQSVIFGSLTLRRTRTLNFGVKSDFSKLRMEPVMHDFLAITENRKREIRTIE